MQVKQENTHQNRSPIQFMSAPVHQSQDIPLPLIKKVQSSNNQSTPSATSTSRHSPTIDNIRPMSSSMGRCDTGIKANLELILKAIQHIEGEGSKSSEHSAYVRQLAESLNSRSASVLKQLLSDEYRNNKSRDSPHSMDSLS